MYTPRTVAVACLYDTLRELNFRISSFEDWCSEIGKVDDRDVDGILCVYSMSNFRRNRRLTKSKPRGQRGNNMNLPRNRPNSHILKDEQYSR